MSFGHKSKITFIRKAKSRDEILEEEQDLQDSRGAPPANFVSFLTPEAFGWMNKRRPNAKSSAAKEHIPPSKALMLKQIFRGLDFDGSGEISLDELKEAISYVAGNHLEGEKPIFDDVEKITKFFEAMDTDGSGAVDFNEFLVAMTSQGKDSASTDMNRMQHAFKDFAKKHRRQKLIDRLEDKTLDDLDRLEEARKLFSLQYFEPEKTNINSVDEQVKDIFKEANAEKAVLRIDSDKIRRPEIIRARIAAHHFRISKESTVKNNQFIDILTKELDTDRRITAIELANHELTKKLRSVSTRSHATYTPSLKDSGKTDGMIAMAAKLQCRSIKVGEEKKKVTFLPPPEAMSVQRMKKSAM